MTLSKKKYHRISLKTKKRINKRKRQNKSRNFRKSKKGHSKKKAKIRAQIGASPEKPPIYQLFTDVDDTLHPAGMLAVGPLEIAGVDRSGPRHEFYDCVAKLHQQIQAQNRGLPTVVISSNPLPASARKKEHYKNVLGIDEIEIKSGDPVSSTWSILKNLRRKAKETFAPLPHGHTATDPDNSHFQNMANVKVNQITAYVTEKNSDLVRKGQRYRPIWIGDNGQGDLLAAKILLEKKVIYAALIHNVDPNKSSGKNTLWYRNYNPPRLYPFKNYGQAIEFLKNYEGLRNLTSCHVANESPHHLLKEE